MIYLGRAKRALTVQVSPQTDQTKTQPTAICAKFNANRIKKNVAKRQQAETKQKYMHATNNLLVKALTR